MTHLEIVKSTYEGKTSEENGKNLESHLAANASWREAEGFPYAGFYQGYSEVAENVFAKLAREWVDYRFLPEGFVAEGDKVVAYGTYEGIFKETGKSMRARVAHLWQLRDGKIIAFEQFVDSLPVNKAMRMTNI